MEVARGLKPSARGELEITDVNTAYLGRDTLRVEKIGRGMAWLDTGTFETLLQAANFIETVEQRQGLKHRLPRRDRLAHGHFIDDGQLERLALEHTGYGDYLLDLLK